MIGAALLALQLAAVGPAALAISAPGSQSSVAIQHAAAGPMVALEQLAPVIPITVRATSAGHFLVALATDTMELVAGAPYARVGPSIIPLGAAPYLAGTRLYAPLQIVAELLPRLFPALLSYDAARGELRYLPPGSPKPVESVARSPARPEPRIERSLRIVVDAGHGGPDNGMTGPIGASPKIREKNITLSVAKKLAAILRARGAEVLMTRTTDTLIALSDRGRLANDFHGDVFVSIHVNAANPNWTHPERARGFETYFLAEAKTEDDRRVERMENESVRFETDASAAKNDPLNFIINDMAQNEHLRESSELASLIEERLDRMHPGPNRGVKQAGFRVLVTAYMPAVLVEIGFGTNPTEARFISDPQHQSDIATAVADATLEYLHRYERRLGTVNR